MFCVEWAVEEEPFVVLLADDFLIVEGVGTTADFAHANTNFGKSQISVILVVNVGILKYVLFRPRPVLGHIAELVEKPLLYDAASELGSVGCYLLMPGVFEILRSQGLLYDGETQLSDAITTLAAREGLYYVSLSCLRFDCGSVDAYAILPYHIVDRELHKF